LGLFLFGWLMLYVARRYYGVTFSSPEELTKYIMDHMHEILFVGGTILVVCLAVIRILWRILAGSFTRRR